MNCWSCNHELIWGGDHDGEDYCNEEYNIVTNLHCPRCEAFVLVYHSPKDPEDRKQEPIDTAPCSVEPDDIPVCDI